MQNIKGTTSTGFKYTINPSVLRDWDFLENAEKLKSGDASMGTIKNTLVLLIGESGFDKLKEHARKQNDGFADVEFMMNTITEIVSSDALKN